MNQQTSKKKLVFNSIIYSCSGILLKCFSFFLLPLYTVYLTTEDYGITSIATSFITTFSFVATFSLFAAVMRFYVDYKDDTTKLKRFYGSVITFIFISTGFFAVLCTIFRNLLTRYIFQGIDYYPIILLTLISLAFCCQQTVYTNILQSQQKAMKCSILNIVFFFISVTLNIIFIVVLKWGAVGSLTATTLGYIIYTAYFLVDMVRHDEIQFCLDKGLLKEALRYSIPIMPHNLSPQISELVSKVLIGGKVSMAGVGLYSISMQFGSIAATFQHYVDQAYGPWLYEQIHSQETGYKSTIRGISRVLTSVLGLFFLGICLFAQDYIVLFLEKSYAAAWKYVPFVVMVLAIKTAYYFYVEILFYYKKASRKLFIATLTSSILNIIFTSLLVPIMGIVGSIVADMICMVIRVGIIIAISKQYDDIGLRIGDFISNFIVLFLFVFAGLWFSYIKFPYTFSIYNFFYKWLIVLLYIGYIFILNRNEIMPLVALLKKKFKK